MTSHIAPSAASQQLAKLALELGVEPLAARLQLDAKIVERIAGGQRPSSRLRQKLAGNFPHIADRDWKLAPVAVVEPEPPTEPATCASCGRTLEGWCRIWP